MKSILIELLRNQGHSLIAEAPSRGNYCSLCSKGSAAGIPIHLILPGLSQASFCPNTGQLPTQGLCSTWTALANYRNQVEKVNKQGLSLVAGEIRRRGIDDGNSVLIGDAAILLGLYGSLAAFPARFWAVGCSQDSISDESVTEQAIRTVPDNIRFGNFGRIGTLGRDYLKRVEVDGFTFRIPTGELLLVFLAARIGEPEASLEGAPWAHFIVMATAAGSSLNLNHILKLADAFGCRERVECGLQIVLFLCRELSPMIPASKLRIPAWQRLTLRFAAARMLREAVHSDDVAASEFPNSKAQADSLEPIIASLRNSLPNSLRATGE